MSTTVTHPVTPIDPKKKERFAELGLSCTQHEAGQGVGVHAPH